MWAAKMRWGIPVKIGVYIPHCFIQETLDEIFMNEIVSANLLKHFVHNVQIIFFSSSKPLVACLVSNQTEKRVVFCGTAGVVR